MIYRASAQQKDISSRTDIHQSPLQQPTEPIMTQLGKHESGLDLDLYKTCIGRNQLDCRKNIY